MSRLNDLAEKLDKIYQDHKAEIDTLETSGPNGGRNALYIDGWIGHGNGTITRAANLSRLPVLPLWTGQAPTPSSAIPLCALKDAEKAYKDIYQK